MSSIIMNHAQVEALRVEALRLRAIYDAHMDRVEAGGASVGDGLSDYQRETIRRVTAATKAHFADGHHKGMAHVVAAIIQVDPKAFTGLVKNSRAISFPHDIPALLAEDGHYLAKYVAVVPLSNPNSHNYPVGKVAFMSGGLSGLRLDMTKGNCLPMEANRETQEYNVGWRLATVPEINEAIAEMIAGMPVQGASAGIGW